MSRNKKIKIILVSSILLTTMAAGTAFASSDAGNQLSNWYQDRFQQATDSIDGQNFDYYLNQVKEQLEADKASIIDQSNKVIQDTYAFTLSDSIWGIWEHKKMYIDQITQTQANIENRVANDFDQYVAESNERVNTVVDQEAKKFLMELNDTLDEELERLKGELNQISRKAQSNLEGEITSAKSSIASDIQVQQGAAQTKVEQNLDESIETVKKLIKEDINSTSNTIISDIQEEALKLETRASIEMEDVLSNMNK